METVEFRASLVIGTGSLSFDLVKSLTDRLPAELRQPMVERAQAWFAEALSVPVRLDRLVVFAEPEPGAAFERHAPDYVLRGM